MRRVAKWVGIALGALIALGMVVAIVSPAKVPAPAAAAPSERPAVVVEPPATPARKHYELTDKQQLQYTVDLLAAVPSTKERVERGGDVYKAAKYVARDGVRICESQDRGADPRKTMSLMFPASPESDYDAIIRVTNEVVCPLGR